jgi:excisionase family DNA binding protein
MEAISSRALEHPPVEFLTLAEVAHYLHLDADHRDGVSAVRFLIRTRKLRAVKVGKAWRIRRRWVDEFADTTSTAPARVSSRLSEAR